MLLLDNIFPVMEHKCISRVASLHLRVVLTWGDATWCCSAGAFQGERTRGWWYLVVFVGYRRVWFELSESFLQPGTQAKTSWGGSFIYDQEMITDVPLARSRFRQGSISHRETGNHLASDQNSHWPVGSCSCSLWSLRVSFYFPCQQQRSWAAHGRPMHTNKASISDPCGHTNPRTSPVEAAEA